MSTVTAGAGIATTAVVVAALSYAWSRRQYEREPKAR